MSRALRYLILAVWLTAGPSLAADPKPVPDSGGGFSGHATGRHFTAPQAAAFAKQVELSLASKGAHVALVFRSGRPRDKLPAGIDYTHGAFWIYGDIKGGDGRLYKGYASYNLYQGDGTRLATDQSYLAQDFPLDFISGSQVDDVAIIIPTPEMQRRIAAVIASPSYERLHIDDYSLVSNPFDARYQNCTEFVLDVIASAAWQTTSYPQIKANLAAHFKPTVIHANVFERIFGPMVDPRLKMDDQDGPIVTATYASIAAFMQDNHLLAETYRLDMAPVSPPPDR